MNEAQPVAARLEPQSAPADRPAERKPAGYWYGQSLATAAIMVPITLGLFPVRLALHDLLGHELATWLAISWQLANTVIWGVLAIGFLGLVRARIDANTAAGRQVLVWSRDWRALAPAFLAAVLIHAVGIATASTVLVLGRDRPAFLPLCLDILLIYAPMSVMTGVGLIAAAMLSAEHRGRMTEAAARRDLTRQLDDARVRALRAQLEPHFLFNALGAAATLARRNDGAAAAHVLVRLSEILRAVLAASSATTTSVAEEVAFAVKYLEIEQVRFGDRLDVRVATDPATAAIRVPTLILQPLVDNAVKHGIACREREGGYIAIRTWRDKDTLVLEVEDNGPGPATPALRHETGLGLEATRQRLGSVSAAATLDLARTPDGATVSRIRIPVADAHS